MMNERNVEELKSQEQRLLIELFNTKGYFRDEFVSSDLNKMLENIAHDMPLFANTAIDNGDALADKTKEIQALRRELVEAERVIEDKIKRIEDRDATIDYLLDKYYDVIYPSALKKLESCDGEGLTPDESQALLRKIRRLGVPREERFVEPDEGCDAEVRVCDARQAEN